MAQDHHEIQIITRVAQLPLVHSAWGIATDGYSRIKSYNNLVKATLNKAERSILYVAESAKPVIQKLDKPLTFADSIACTGLDKLQQKVPAINKSPEELRGETKKWYDSGVNRMEDIKKMGTDRVKGIKDYGYNKVHDSITNVLNTPYFQALLKSVDTAIVLTENTVDHYLPPAPNEPRTEETKDQNLVSRMGHLSDKMRKRVYANIFSKYVPLVIVAINNFKATVLVWFIPNDQQHQSSN